MKVVIASDWSGCVLLRLSSLLQHHNSKKSVIWCLAFFMVHISYPYMTTGKAIAFTLRTFVGKLMSLLLNMLSKFVKLFFQGAKTF